MLVRLESSPANNLAPSYPATDKNISIILESSSLLYKAIPPFYFKDFFIFP